MCYSTLKTINENLDKIAAQSSWKLGIYSDINTTAVDDCLNPLSIVLKEVQSMSDITSDVHGLT